MANSPTIYKYKMVQKHTLLVQKLYTTICRQTMTDKEI